MPLLEEDTTNGSDALMRWVLGVLGFSCEKLASKLKSYGLTDRSLEIANPYGNPPQYDTLFDHGDAA
jgi:hypothetical protein